jgi:hypothetical protein
LYRKLNIGQLSRFIGIHERLPINEKIALSKEYMKLHKDGLELGEYGSCNVLEMLKVKGFYFKNNVSMEDVMDVMQDVVDVVMEDVMEDVV